MITPGHNSDPFAVARDTLADLLDEAKAWLDGSPIADADQAAGIRLLQVKIREAHKEGDAARMAATEPHRKAEAAINAQWKPVLAPAKTALDTLGTVLGAWQAAEQRKADELARQAREAAAQAEREAQEAFQRASSVNLAERQAAEDALQRAAELAAAAAKAEQAKTGAKDVLGIGRRSALIVTREPVAVTDGKAALQWAMRTVPDELRAWLLAAAKRHKGGDVPGVEYATKETAR